MLYKSETLVPMRIHNSSFVRKYFSDILNIVTEDKDEIVITRRDGADVVMLSLSHYEEMLESQRLLSPVNAQQIAESLSQTGADSLLDDPDWEGRVRWTPVAWSHRERWFEQSTKERLRNLIDASLSDPASGLGKPVSLHGGLAGLWSRRIDSMHRLIYQMTNDGMVVLSCRQDAI